MFAIEEKNNEIPLNFTFKRGTVQATFITFAT